MSETVIGSADFERFRATFFEECAEILAELETHLSQAQDAPLDNEGLNAVFRAAHSIKAGAGAFGYADLVRFTHAFEALLDKLRSGKIQQSDRVSQVLQRGGDVLATLVGAAQNGENLGPDYGADVMEDFHALMADGTGEDGPTHASAQPKKSAATDAAQPAAGSGFKVTFAPKPELLRNANEPVLLIRELRQLGQVTISCDTSRLPPLEQIDAEDCYLSFVFVVETDKPRSAIAEVFEFVDDCCDLVIEPLAGQATPAETPAQTSPDEAAEGQGNVVTLAVATAPPATAGTAGTAPPAAPTAGQGTAGKAPAPSSIRVDLSRIDRLVNMVGELVITQAMLAQQINDLTVQHGRQTIRGHEELATLTRELQECVMAIRMQPVKSVFARMPRLVRDLSSKLSKQVKLVTNGEQTEVDKTVIEELADPLTHMIRNSIDHGIEMPDVRRAAGKPAEGTIELAAAHVGSNILITVADDGAGINRKRLLEKAIEKGIVQAGTQLSDEEIDDLIFAPGFSTAAAVTDVSGRGVGMDVVRRNIVNLGGRIQVTTVPGKGTRFTLVIPLTLAVLDGMVVAVGNERYILPLTSIVESYRPERGSIRRMPSGGDVVSVRGEFIRLVHLDRIFDVPGATEDPVDGLVVLVETANGAKVGITVDELIGQQQVVIKSIADNFDPIRGISGATILGNGRVALILDIEQLITMPERLTRPRLVSSDLMPLAASA